MSVVEKAIRKLQEQRQQSGEPAAPVGGDAQQAHEFASPHPPEDASPSQRLVIALDRGALRSAGLLPPEPDASLLARQYRKIKHPLIAQAIGRGVPRAPKGYLIMISSAVAGEGKTFTSLNLALSLSREKDIKVLLVDADVAKPQLSLVLGVGQGPGLLDALRNTTVDVESLIRDTEVPTLSFLPAGVGSEEATELLSSTRMQQIAELLGRHDSRRLVVFDSPPLLQTTESPALAHVAGQILIVVRAEATPQPLLLDALSTLEGHPAVSLVLNQSTRSVASEYYYYGYGRERAGENGI